MIDRIYRITVVGDSSWRVVNVANVKISSSNVANFQLGIGIGFGNISTLATFTSVGVGEWNWSW